MIKRIGATEITIIVRKKAISQRTALNLPKFSVNFDNFCVTSWWKWKSYAQKDALHQLPSQIPKGPKIDKGSIR